MRFPGATHLRALLVQIPEEVPAHLPAAILNDLDLLSHCALPLAVSIGSLQASLDLFFAPDSRVMSIVRIESTGEVAPRLWGRRVFPISPHSRDAWDVYRYLQSHIHVPFVVVKDGQLDHHFTHVIADYLISLFIYVVKQPSGALSFVPEAVEVCADVIAAWYHLYAFLVFKVIIDEHEYL